MLLFAPQGLVPDSQREWLKEENMPEFFFIRHASMADMSKRPPIVDCSCLDDLLFATNFSINKKGISQAKRTKKALEKFEPSFILSSPLARCIETMELLNPNFKNCKVILLKELKEVLTSIPPDAAEEIKKIGNRDLMNCRDIVERLIKDLFLENKYELSGNIWVVTHGNLIRCIVARLLRADWDSWQVMDIDNCGITKISTCEGRPIITGFNETSHLR